MRRCSRCLRLTVVATSITGQTAKKHSLPLIVRLSQREVQDEVVVEFRSIICALRQDTLLDVAAAITALLATVCDLELRFAQYEDYPSALWKLTRRFNPVGWPSECKTFVQTPSTDSTSASAYHFRSLRWSQGRRRARCVSSPRSAYKRP